MKKGYCTRVFGVTTALTFDKWTKKRGHTVVIFGNIRHSILKLLEYFLNKMSNIMSIKCALFLMDGKLRKTSTKREKNQ